LLFSIIIAALLVGFLRDFTGIGEAGRFASIPIIGAFSIAFFFKGYGIFPLFYLVGL
jgi:hypothetical protein